MNFLFCHDGPLYRRGNEYYGVSFTNETFRQYYTDNDKLSVLTRIKCFDETNPNENLSKITLKNFSVIEAPNLSSLSGIFSRRHHADLIIKKAVEQADYLIVRLPSVIGQTVIKHAKKTNKPYITEVVGCPLDSYWNHSLLGKLVAYPAYVVTKSAIKKSSYVLYVTENFLQKRYPTKGKYIGCSDVELEPIDNEILNKRIYTIEEKKLTESIIIGTVGDVDVSYKGQKYVIKALGRLKRNGYDNYEYQLVGNGNKRKLEKIAEKYDVRDQVKFIGTLSHKKIFCWLDKIDLYIQPSETEGLPRALIEALSRAVPSMGSNVGGIPELLDDDFTFSVSSVKEISNMILSFNKKIMLKEAKRSFKKAQEYDRKSLSEKRQEFYNEFVKHN